MSKIAEYFGADIISKIGEKEQLEIRKILRDYYTYKFLEKGRNEIDLIKMLFDEDLSIEEISSRVNMSERQVRRRRDKYVTFFLKVICLYLENNSNNLTEN